MTEHFTVRLFFLLFVMVLWLVWRVLTLLTKTNIQVRIMFSRALLRSPHLFGSSFCIDRYSLLRRLFLCCFSSRVASTIHARVTIFFKSRRLSYIAYILTCSHANACVFCSRRLQPLPHLTLGIIFSVAYGWNQEQYPPQNIQNKEGIWPCRKNAFDSYSVSSSVSLLTFVTWLTRSAWHVSYWQQLLYIGKL